MSESNDYNTDEKIRDFSNYLLDIGLLIGTCYNDFVNKFKEINEKEKIIFDDEEPDENYDKIYFKDNLSKAMIKFYDSLNEDKKKLTSFNIFNIYSKKKGEKNNNELTEDNYHIDKNEIIEEEGTEKKINNNKIEYKEEHFEISIYSQKSQLILKLSDISESDENTKRFLNKKKKKKKNNSPKKLDKINDKDKLNKIEALNENCTFQPNYDKKETKKEKKNMKNIKEFFDKLSQKNTKREKDVEDIKKDLEKECPFQPNLKNNKIKKQITRKDFEERMKRFEQNKKEKEKRLKKDQEEEFKKICPFIPNNNKNNNKKRSNSFNKSLNQTSENIYKRLHDENKLIKKKYEENLQKLLNDIKDRANHPIVNHNNIRYLKKYKNDKKIYNIKNNYNFNFNFTDKKEEYKTFNSKRIEELYEEYKKMKNDIISKNNKTETNIEVPSINNNNGKENNNDEKENLNLKKNEIINNEEKNN